MPRLQIKADRRDLPAREQLVNRLRAEFKEMPCLRLTQAQARRLFGLRPDICDRVLHALIAERTLHVDGTGRYVLFESAPSRPALPAPRLCHAGE